MENRLQAFSNVLGIKLKSSFQNLKLKKKMNNTQEITTCYQKITAKNIKQIEYRSKLVL